MLRTPTPPAGPAKVKLNMSLPSRSKDRLDKLVEKTEADSYGEVIKNALRLYDYMIEQIEAGHELQLRRKDGAVVALMPFEGMGEPATEPPA